MPRPAPHPAAPLPNAGVRLPATLRRARRPATAGRILAAAERLFAERGLAGARTGQIARAARVNKALLYYYFRSKEKLYFTVLDSLFGQLLDSVEAGMKSASLPRLRLLAYMNSYFDFILGHPNYPRLVQRELMEGGKHLRWISERYFAPIQRELSRIIAAGTEAGEFWPVDPVQTVLTVNSMVVSYFAIAPMLNQVLGRDALHSEAIEARRRAILDFVEHGLLRHPGSHRAARRP
jgi:AcrR family transcriptional regulator